MRILVGMAHYDTEVCVEVDNKGYTFDLPPGLTVDGVGRRDVAEVINRIHQAFQLLLEGRQA